MPIEAVIVADSVNPNGVRITTFALKMPRYILAEHNTHRVFSRNASSSRAIPVKKIIQQVIDDPVIPTKFGRNQPGMQAGEELTGADRDEAVALWLEARDEAVKVVRKLVEKNIHKETVNRILEPWMWCYNVTTSTDWANFFTLRHHIKAHPDYLRLAELMAKEFRSHEPTKLPWLSWHLPFITDEEKWASSLTIEQQIQSSVARCARVSYNNHDGTSPVLDKDLTLHDDLVVESPAHASPAEHQAQANENEERSGNFSGGWLQYRKIIPMECATTFPWDETIQIPDRRVKIKEIISRRVECLVRTGFNPTPYPQIVE